MVLHNLAVALDHENRVAEAEPLLRRALTLSQRNGQNRDLQSELGQLGVNLMRQGKFREA